jgi:hypothetical protein
MSSKNTSILGSGAVTYTIGGTVTGLTSGTLVAKNNSGDALTVATNSTSFTFSTPLASGAAYAVSVGTQPSGLACSVSNGTGTVAGVNVTTVVVACVSTWTGTKQLGVAGQTTIGQSVTTDTSGNVYVAGYTYGGCLCSRTC